MSLSNLTIIIKYVIICLKGYDIIYMNCMTLKDLGINTRTVNALAERKIENIEDVARHLPRRYYDFSCFRNLQDAIDNISAIPCVLIKCKSSTGTGKTILTAKGECLIDGRQLNVTWIGQKHMVQVVERFVSSKTEVVIYGKTKFDDTYGFSLINPISIKPKHEHKAKIEPVYRKIKGVSDDMFKTILDKCLEEIKEPLDDKYYEGRLTYTQSLAQLHHPSDLEMVKCSQSSLDFYDLVYFNTRIKLETVGKKASTDCRLKSFNMCRDIEKALPYDLTQDQKTSLNGMVSTVNHGKRLNALLQGDVGCGKSIVAFLLMSLFSENGYQSCLIAPTTVLAYQHYDDMKKLFPEEEIAFLCSDITGKEKDRVIERIASGSAKYVVGTHSLLSEKVLFNNLQLMIVDEEHKFGVNQKQLLIDKYGNINNLTMSATPIPRTLASSIYGDEKAVYSIKEMPNGRKPVQTAINSSDEVIYRWVEQQILNGRQCYVVCPLVDGEDKAEALENVLSAEEAYEQYTERFKNTSFRIAVVTGQTKDKDAILADFKDHKIDILISTTVIEVGVNVPNANIIVIVNAERYGLAGLHQLRGRVGRGEYQSYCILKSKEKDNERLLTMCETNNGFKIAERDIELRGAGDLLGTEQAGDNHYISLILRNLELNDKAKTTAERIINDKAYKNIISKGE